jgi:uncharacterized protein (DUF1501 family)
MNPQQAYTRREFVRTGLGLVGVGVTVPTFLSDTVAAFADGAGGLAAGGRDERILVVVQLAGGNDGLNTVIPYRSDDYHALRPTLGIKADRVLRLDDALGLHGEAVGLKKLWDDGQLAIVNGVGYPNPNRSHFVGTRIWETADPDERASTGWLGRFFDNTCQGEDRPDPKSSIALVDETPLALSGEKFSPICVADPENWQYRGADIARRIAERRAPVREETPSRSTRGRNRRRATRDADAPAVEARRFLERSMLDTAVAVDDLRRAARITIDGVEFPRGEFARSLKHVAGMIASNMPTRVYYVSLGGFDTHANQEGRHAQLLRQLGDSLSAFVGALQRIDAWERTMIMTFSEFGRRVAENASGGTDHGEAAPMFLLGNGILPGLHGEPPPMDKLHRGDLAFHADFRRVYAAVLKDWLAADAARILGPGFAPLPIIRRA